MTPPRLPQQLLSRLLDSRLGDAVLGDLAEIFAEEARQSPTRARVRYWRRAAGAWWHLRGRRRTRPAPRRSSGDSVMLTMLRDFVRGARLFVTQPAFAWAAVVTLALAIGANTLIFTMANVLVLKPLPFDRPERLGWILGSIPGFSPDRAGTSLPEYAAFRDEVSAFSQLAAWRRQPVTLRDQSQSDRILAQMVLGDLQGLWGLKAARGRPLTLADEQPGSARVAVLAHQFWNARFGADEHVIGRTLVIDGVPHTIVGVLTSDIELGNLSEIDVWLPYTSDPVLAPRANRGWRPVGRLQSQATIANAHVQVAAIVDRLRREYPDTNRDWAARVGTTKEALGGANTWLVLSLLSVVVGLLLLLACANVMNLLIARLIGRRQELAVRTALGATRGRVVRQIIGEGLMLGVAGGVLGLLVAWVGLKGVHAVSTEPFFRQLELDWGVVLFAAALAFVAPLAFSVLPTLRVLRDDVRATLSEGSTRTVGSASAARGRSSLVVLQVSLAVTLLIVAALVVQSMQAIVVADLGYDPSRLLSAQIDVARWKTEDDQAALRLRQRALARVRNVPGVEAAALATELPALQFASTAPFDISGRPAPDERDRPSAGLTIVTADYFNTIGVPLVAGRGFDPADTSSPHAVVVISAEAARRFWPSSSDALGSTIRISDPAGPPIEATVIGVARNVANPMITQPSLPTLYLLDEHRPTRTMHVVVRAAAPALLGQAIREAIAEVDPDLPAYQLRTVTAAMEDENSSNVLLSGMFVAFAAIAVLLAMAGLYGVMSYAVSQRSGEIAVRLALGAPTRVIARQVIGQSVTLAAIGIAIGAVCAYILARSIASLLFGVTAADVTTYGASVALTLAAAVVATWLPMRRAATIDPLESLRRT